MKARGLLAGLAAASLTAVACSSQAQEPDDRMLDRIEAEVALPRGASPVRAYSRYYARRRDGSIIGIYLRSGAPHPPGRRWVPETDLPGISDGGCSMVTVIFEASGNLRSVRCNGLA